MAAASSLAGASRQETRRRLTELARANLLVEHVPGRYAFHDLLRAYAVDLGREHESGPERRAAAGRLLDYYAHTAHAADRLLYPHRDPIRLPLDQPAVDASSQRLADDRQAMAWLTAEHPVLVAVVQVAAATGADGRAWQLAWALDTYLDRQGNWHDLVATWRTALHAAARIADLAVRADAYRCLAYADTRLGHNDDAHAHLRAALGLYDRVGDRIGQANTHNNLAILHEREGDLRQALRHVQRALALYHAAGHRRSEAVARNGVGWYHALLGDHAAALTYCEHALTIFRELSDHDGEAITWDSLGYAHHHAGQYAAAADCYQRALVLFRGLHARYHEAMSLSHLGDTRHAAGQLDAAQQSWEQALVILDELGHADAEQVRVKLKGAGY